MTTNLDGFNHPFKRKYPDQSSSFFNQKNSNVPTGQRYLTIKSLDGNKALNELSVFQKTKGLAAISTFADIVAKLKDGTLLVLTKTKQAADIIIRAKHLANVEIVVAEHEFLNFTKGIIFSNDILNLTNAELLEEFKSQHVVDIYRIQKRKPNSDEFENTPGLILTFNLMQIPETIIAGYVNIRVRQYIPNPLRCRKCQLFGHTKNKCSNEAACDVCSIKDVHNLPCGNTKQCVNCGGSHSSFDRKCEVFIKEAEVMFLKTTQRISYFEAKKQVDEKNKQQLSLAAVVSSNQNPSENSSEISKLKDMIEELNRTAKASQLELVKKLEELSLDNKKLVSINEKLTKRIESQAKTIVNLQSSSKEKRKNQKSPVVFNTRTGVCNKPQTSTVSKIQLDNFLNLPGSSGINTSPLYPQTPLLITTEKKQTNITNTITPISNILVKNQTFTLKKPSNPNILPTNIADLNPENHNPDSMEINV